MSEKKTSDQDGAPDLDSATLSNPRAVFKMMRDHSPVLDVGAMPGPMGGVMVSKHEDVLSVLRDPEIFSSRDDAIDIGQVRPLIPLQLDPPEQTKYRKLMAPLFAPAAIAKLEGRTRSLVTELIDAVVEDGHCNFHQAVAEPLPCTVFLELLGLPLERAREFIELKDGIIRPPTESPDEHAAIVKETGQKIYAVLEEVVAARATEPRNDFISGFLASEVDGERLSREDVIDIGYLFFLAGLDTVTASLDCSLAFLAQHPEHRQELVDDPSLIPEAIEELLRFESPVGGVPRIATRDTELSGCPIKAGTQVCVNIGSANTDERFWENPDTVDFHREVNRHISFGAGAHRCLGSHLARMELRVALEEWHRRIPSYQLAPGTELVYTQGLRQVENLDLVW